MWRGRNRNVHIIVLSLEEPTSSGLIYESASTDLSPPSPSGIRTHWHQDSPALPDGNCILMPHHIPSWGPLPLASLPPKQIYPEMQPVRYFMAVSEWLSNSPSSQTPMGWVETPGDHPNPPLAVSREDKLARKCLWDTHKMRMERGDRGRAINKQRDQQDQKPSTLGECRV